MMKRVLLDVGAGLNICTLKLINQLRYFYDVIDKNRSITIRAYDDMETNSKGTIRL